MLEVAGRNWEDHELSECSPEIQLLLAPEVPHQFNLEPPYSGCFIEQQQLLELA